MIEVQISADVLERWLRTGTPINRCVVESGIPEQCKFDGALTRDGNLVLRFREQQETGRIQMREITVREAWRR